MTTGSVLQHGEYRTPFQGTTRLTTDDAGSGHAVPVFSWVYGFYYYRYDAGNSTPASILWIGYIRAVFHLGMDSMRLVFNTETLLSGLGRAF